MNRKSKFGKSERNAHSLFAPRAYHPIMQTSYEPSDSLFRPARYPDRISAHVPRGWRAQLYRAAEREGVSFAEILRRAIQRSIAEQAGEQRPC